jgi:hypothetical protein
MFKILGANIEHEGYLSRNSSSDCFSREGWYCCRSYSHIFVENEDRSEIFSKNMIHNKFFVDKFESWLSKLKFLVLSQKISEGCKNCYKEQKNG